MAIDPSVDIILVGMTRLIVKNADLGGVRAWGGVYQQKLDCDPFRNGEGDRGGGGEGEEGEANITSTG